MKNKTNKRFKRLAAALLLVPLVLCSAQSQVLAEESGGITGTVANDPSNRVWGKLFGSSCTSFAYCNGGDHFNAVTAADDGYIAVGNMNDGGDMAGMFDSSSINAQGFKYGCAIVKFKEKGNSAEVAWKKTLFGVVTNNTNKTSDSYFSDYESKKFWVDLTDIVRTKDGGYIAVGTGNGNYATNTYVPATKENIDDYKKILNVTLQDEKGNKFLVPYHTGFDALTSISDAIAIKLDDDGNIKWVKMLGGSDKDSFTSVVPASDGGFFATGYSSSADGDFTAAAKKSNLGSSTKYSAPPDGFVAKYSPDGDSVKLDFVRTVGGTGIDYLTGAVETSDGGYGVVGFSLSSDIKDPKTGEVLPSHPSENMNAMDGFSAKLDSKGDFLWCKDLGGSVSDMLTAAVATDDGGFIAAGYSNSKDGDFADANKGGATNKLAVGNNDYDAVAVRYDGDGNKKWLKAYGGASGEDYFKSVAVSPEGGLAFGGLTNSTDGDLASKQVSGFDFWLVNTDNDGNIKRVSNFGGTKDEQAYPYLIVDPFGNGWPYGQHGMIALKNGYLFAGASFSNSGIFDGQLKTDGSAANAAIVMASYDNDQDGVEDALDYYPQDASKWEAPKECLDASKAAVKTEGDGTQAAYTLAKSDCFASYKDSAGKNKDVQVTDNIEIRLSSGSFSFPADVLEQLYKANNDNPLVFSTAASESSIKESETKLLSGDTLIGSIDLSVTDTSGNKVTPEDGSFLNDIKVTVKFLDAAAITKPSALKLYYYNNGKLEEQASAVTVNSDGTVSFYVKHFSTYAIVQTADTALTTANTTSTTGTASTSSAAVVANPKTGDSLYLYETALLASGLSLTGIVILKRKNRMVKR